MWETAMITIAEPSLSLKSLGMEVAMERPCAAGVHFLGFDDVIASFSALRASAPKSRSGLGSDFTFGDGCEEPVEEALSRESFSGTSVERWDSTARGRTSGLASASRDSIEALERSVSGAILIERS